MSKSVKTGLALSKFKDATQRSDWKHAMIDATLTEQFVPRVKKSELNRADLSAVE